MTRHSVNNNTGMDLVISLCSNSSHLMLPQTASNFRHLLTCGTYRGRTFKIKHHLNHNHYCSDLNFLVLSTGMQISSAFRIRIHGFGFGVSHSEVEYETEKFESDFLVF